MWRSCQVKPVEPSRAILSFISNLARRGPVAAFKLQPSVGLSSTSIVFVSVWSTSSTSRSLLPRGLRRRRPDPNPGPLMWPRSPKPRRPPVPTSGRHLRMAKTGSEAWLSDLHGLSVRFDNVIGACFLRSASVRSLLDIKLPEAILHMSFSDPDHFWPSEAHPCQPLLRDVGPPLLPDLSRGRRFCRRRRRRWRRQRRAAHFSVQVFRVRWTHS